MGFVHMVGCMTLNDFYSQLYLLFYVYVPITSCFVLVVPIIIGLWTYINQS